MKKNSINLHTLLSNDATSLKIAPQMEHYCAVKSKPATFQEIYNIYKEFKIEGGTLVIHYINDQSTLVFRFTDLAYLTEFSSPTCIESIGRRNGNVYRYETCRIYKIKRIPQMAYERITCTRNNKEVSLLISSIFFNELNQWTGSKPTENWHHKISGILRSYPQPPHRESLRSRMRKLLFK